jgi:hypothetical protein
MMFTEYEKEIVHILISDSWPVSLLGSPVSAQREQPAEQANTTERKQIGASARRPDLWSVEVVAEDGIAIAIVAIVPSGLACWLAPFRASARSG